MCGIYYHRSAFLYYQFCLPVCPNIHLCIALPFISTLGGGEIKFVLHHSSTKHHALPRFACYNRVYYITPSQRY